LTAGGDRVVLAAGDEADAAALAGTLGGLPSAAPVKEAIQAADVVLFAAATGPRFSMTRARTRHPGSPVSHPSGRAAASAPLQRHGDGSRRSLTTARSPASPSVSPGTAP